MNGSDRSRVLPIQEPATPTGSNTYVLFDSTHFVGQKMADVGIRRVSFGSKNSHPYTLKEYASSDGGVTWYQVRGDVVVGASAATDISGPYDYPIDMYVDWKLELVNSGTTQSPWAPHLVGHSDRVKAT